MTDPPGHQSEGPRRGLFDRLRRLLRGREDGESVREELEELIEARIEEATPIDPTERAIIVNALRLREVTVEDVKVPRADISAIEVDTPLPEAIRIFGEERHSRLPVYRRNLDDVIGMVHVRDVLPHARDDAPPPLANLARQVLFVAPGMRLLDLLLRMRQTRIHLALVVDEYGGIDGLATIEDLVEQIVGEIEDEHDEDEPPSMVERPDGTVIADARTPLEMFESQFGPILTEEERESLDTLGGLVVTLFGRVPARGERVVHPAGLEFEVLDAEPGRLRRLRIRRLPDAAAAASA